MKATARFQRVHLAYSVLSDDKRRQVYDRTGSIEENEILGGRSGEELQAWLEEMFQRVTQEALDEFSTSYRGFLCVFFFYDL